MRDIPNKYRKAGVLLGILQKSINDNWDRIKDDYNTACDYIDSRQHSTSVDGRMLTQFRKDIRKDGAGFIQDPDGIGSRLNDWIREAFPKAFE